MAVAFRRFASAGHLAIAPLVRDLCVSRATLYRVIGSRDRLLGDVLWELARRTLDMVIEQVESTNLSGVDRLLEISHRFHEEVAGFEPMQRFLETEPEDAFRILFTSSGRVHERMVEAWTSLLREALQAGEIEALPFGVNETAYIFVRIGESILYADMLAGIVPDRKLGDQLRRTILDDR